MQLNFQCTTGACSFLVPRYTPARITLLLSSLSFIFTFLCQKEIENYVIILDLQEFSTFLNKKRFLVMFVTVNTYMQKSVIWQRYTLSKQIKAVYPCTSILFAK